MNKCEKKLIMRCVEELQNIMVDAVENENELNEKDILKDMLHDLCSLRDVLVFLSGKSVLSIKG